MSEEIRAEKQLPMNTSESEEKACVIRQPKEEFRKLRNGRASPFHKGGGTESTEIWVLD